MGFAQENLVSGASGISDRTRTWSGPKSRILFSNGTAIVKRDWSKRTTALAERMSAYFERLVDFVGAHPQLSLLAVFLLALSEAVPVVGTVVPGSTLILAISALATAARINPWALLVAAVLGAIAGDGFSFWLGHHYHRQILSGWPLNRFPRHPFPTARCRRLKKLRC
jgi:membrane protein DedA with SNARE-associated domain